MKQPKFSSLSLEEDLEKDLKNLPMITKQFDHSQHEKHFYLQNKLTFV